MSTLAVIGVIAVIAFVLATCYDGYVQYQRYENIYIGDALMAGIYPALVCSLIAIILHGWFV